MNTYLKLAQDATEHFVKKREPLPVPNPLFVELNQQRACYVYLFDNPGRKLRAVYGSPLPRYTTLGQEIILNTTEALIRHSFRPLNRADLSSITHTVAIIDPLQRISDQVQLNPEQHGLYIRSDRNKTAILFPDRTGIETARDQIATAIRESQINPRQESFTMYRFGVTYHE